MVSVAARTVGMTRNGFDMMIKRHPTLMQAKEEAREEMLDTAENKLADLIEEGNLGAIIYYLKCQGKARGYVENIQISDVTEKAADRLTKVLETFANKLPD
jgi:hypothetical protein